MIIILLLDEYLYDIFRAQLMHFIFFLKRNILIELFTENKVRSRSVWN